MKLPRLAQASTGPRSDAREPPQLHHDQSHPLRAAADLAALPHFPLRNTPGGQELFVSIFFLLAFVTDGVDGYLARKNGQITTLGTLLDPLGG